MEQTKTTKIAIELDCDLLETAQSMAAEQGCSVQDLLVQPIKLAAQRRRDYPSARRRALRRLRKGFSGAWRKPASRDELYER